MATEKSALRITELDFDAIKENLKQYLRSQDEFKDFDFEGPGMSVLLDILSYNTHYMSYYLNMVGNEMFLDTAQLRSSVLSHAKHINYVPGSKQGALAKVNIQITPSNSENQSLTFVTLDKYTRLLGKDIDGINYPFVTLYSNTVNKTGNSFLFSNVMIKQGEVITLQYPVNASNPRRQYEIPSQNVDTTTISVSVQESASNVDTKVYTLSEDITEVNANSTVYFLEENENLNYTLYFGDDVIGKKPKDGNIIIVTYLDNVGSVSNNISSFVFSEEIGNEYRDNVIVTSIGSSYGGVEKENIEQVRFRAPYFYTTQNRAVTVEDYQTLLVKDYNYIDSVSVWGGEDNDPVIYGKVFISIKTKGNFALTNFEKENIKNSLIGKRNVLTVTPEIIDPDFVYLMVSGNIYYDSKLTSRTSGELAQIVRAAIQDYGDNELNKFGATYSKYKLQNYIENCDKSITGSDIQVLVQKRLEVDTTRQRNYILSFNIPLRKSACKDRLTTFPEIVINDASNTQRNVIVEEVTENRPTGIYEIQITDGGRGYTVAPTVTVTGDGTGATAVAEVLSGRVNKITITNPGINYSTALVSISGGDGVGASAIAKLDVEKGNLRAFYYKPNGERVVISDNFGTVFYRDGRIEINSVRISETLENEFYDENTLTFTVPTLNEIILPLRNRILTIDDGDARSIQINMIAN